MIIKLNYVSSASLLENTKNKSFSKLGSYEPSYPENLINFLALRHKRCGFRWAKP